MNVLNEQPPVMIDFILNRSMATSIYDRQPVTNESLLYGLSLNDKNYTINCTPKITVQDNYYNVDWFLEDTSVTPTLYSERLGKQFYDDTLINGAKYAVTLNTSGVITLEKLNVKRKKLRTH